ncbi:hypothetical protein CCP3SC15_1310007 [Gammaproteobacteria bacterium]
MDTNLVLRDGTAALAGDETLTSVKIGPMTRPLWLHVTVEKTSAGDTLDVELEFCALAASTTEIYNMNMKQISTLGHYSIPFYTQLEYLQVKLNETNNGGLDFGVVKVWIDDSGRYVGAYNK